MVDKDAKLRAEARSPEGIKAELAWIERLVKIGQTTEAHERLNRVKPRYAQLSQSLKESVADDFERVSEVVRTKVEKLLEDDGGD